MAEAHSDEGLFTFDRPPRELLKNRYGFELSDQRIADLLRSIVRFGRSGSGAFVSDRGLVATNRHVGLDCIQKVSIPGRDVVRDGYMAVSEADEIVCPGMEVEVPVDTEDVTARIRAASAGATTAAEGKSAHKKAAADIERECGAATGLRCNVVPLFGGGRYVLQTFRRHAGVRLVFAPEQAAAWFGDRAARSCAFCDFDIAFFRVYEDGEPWRPKHLRWATGGVAGGALVLVASFPGFTARTLTRAQLDAELSVMAPFRVRFFEAFKKHLETAGRGRGRVGALLAEDIRGLDEARWRQGQAIEERAKARFLERFAAADAALSAPRDSDPAAGLDAKEAIESIAAVQATKTALLKQAYVAQLVGDYVDHLRYAQTIVRMSGELAKPDDERFEEYREGALPTLVMWLNAPVAVDKAAERARLGAALRAAADVLGPADAVVVAALGGAKPAVVSARAVDGTRAGDAAWRKEVVDRVLKIEPGGRRGFIEGLGDPMIALALRLDPVTRELRRRYADEVEAVERDGATKLHAARVARGVAAYPDAIYTPRLSFGLVKGCGDGDCRAVYTLRDVFGEPKAPAPAALPPRWRKKKAAVDLALPLVFLHTADFVTGSSGGPVMNRDGKVAGVLFAGNKAAMLFRYAYEEGEGRAAALSVPGVLHVLEKVYGFDRLVRELSPHAVPVGAP
ncbi:MAG: S46 family peptidase [Deltaproteobacteria bacterium]|nr:S46 family peptidase [Deltaproteobacteria bacterium]